MANAPVEIKLMITDCSECPKHRTERTPRSVYANDYFCILTGDKIAGYIEWPDEMPPVPKNCPLR